MFSYGGDEPPKNLRFEPNPLRYCHHEPVRIWPTRMVEETPGRGKSCGESDVPEWDGRTGGGDGLRDGGRSFQLGEERYRLSDISDQEAEGEEVEESKVKS